ncbi:neuromedin Bb [Thalassophryne amazonica]|uniref:neuromedin Bb n=1 Tax=Thalassophryne amazonica TaxID=390379 RepID=UPI0014720BD2|nr:neuromedin Bb [Thalassophryne amazonica]
MRGSTVNHACRCGFLIYLVVSYTAAVSFDLTELRNKVAKIKVNPRGNLWATGHFMGKKSVMDSTEQMDDALEVAVSAEQSAVRKLFQVLQIVLQAQVEESRSKHQEGELFMKILENYIQSRK